MQVNLYDVIDAIENTIEGNEWYYYIPGQRIIGRNRDGFYGEGIPQELPMKEVVLLPDHRTVDDYGNMVRFIENEVKGEAQEWLRNSIKGRGAFRRFRGTLERFLLTEDWYDYLFECHRNTAIDWCEQNGIVYTEEEPEPQEDAFYDDEDDYEEPAPVPEIVRIQPLRAVRVTEQNYLNIVFPAAQFAVVMDRLHGQKTKEDAEQAQEHLEELLSAGDEIWAVSDRGRFVSYCVFHEDHGSVIMDELYTVKDFRRHKAASLLLQKAEETAESLGGTVRFFVLPQNRELIAFLAANGYHTLKAVEIGKDSGAGGTITVGEDTFQSEQ